VCVFAKERLMDFFYSGVSWIKSAHMNIAKARSGVDTDNEDEDAVVSTSDIFSLSLSLSLSFSVTLSLCHSVTLHAHTHTNTHTHTLSFTSLSHHSFLVVLGGIICCCGVDGGCEWECDRFTSIPRICKEETAETDRY